MQSGTKPAFSLLSLALRSFTRKLSELRERRVSNIHTPWDFRPAAKRALPKMVFDYIDGGAGDDGVVEENRRAFERIRLVASAPFDVSTIDLSTELFGQKLSLPIIIGPTGLASASWPRGEIAFARMATKNGIRYVMPTSASVSPEDVAEAGDGHVWFQLYPPPDREMARVWLERIRRCGFSAVEITLDVAIPGRRLRDARNAFVMPFRWSPRKVLSVASHPAWAVKMLYHGQPVPYFEMNDRDRAQIAKTQAELRAHRYTRALSWDLLKMLRDEWDGPMILKGLVDPRQAKPAVEAGFDGIVVSNHGGRQLDGAVSSIEVLPEFRSEAGAEFPLILDSGIRNGADIVKAIALGANAVQLGRSLVFALATAGETGIDRGLELFRSELEIAMGLCGVNSIDQIGPHTVRPAR